VRPDPHASHTHLQCYTAIPGELNLQHRTNAARGRRSSS
jgi:hypothetical protein